MGPEGLSWKTPLDRLAFDQRMSKQRMKKPDQRTQTVFLTLGTVALLTGPILAGDKLGYPATKKVEQTDQLHGVTVSDPYRWLEDDNSAETKTWVEAQNKITFGWLEQIPERKLLKERLTKTWDYERYGIPYKEGNRYFFSKNDGLQNQ